MGSKVPLRVKSKDSHTRFPMTADTVSGEEIRIMVRGIDTTLGDLSSPWLKLMPKGQRKMED